MNPTGSETVPLMDLGRACLVVTADLSSLAPVDPVLLNTQETARLHRLTRRQDRERFVVGASLLRQVVSSLADVPAAELEVDRTCSSCGAGHGKPQVHSTGLHVSVTHSGRVVQVACTRAAPVGIDIQAAGVPVTSAMRALLVEAGPVTATAAEFLIVWSRVEAIVKATGDGLRLPLDQIRVSGPGEPPRLHSYRGDQLPCVLFDHHGRDGYVGAVAILSATPIELVPVSANRWLRRR